MNSARLLLIALVTVLVATVANAAPFPDSYEPTAAETAALEAKLAQLSEALVTARRGASLQRECVVDVEAHHKAVAWLLRFREEFFDRSWVDKAHAVLDAGLERAARLADGKAPWASTTGRVARAYRSRVDRSVQPYGLIIPSSYDGSDPARLDVVLHGRNAKLNEVEFLMRFADGATEPIAGDAIELHVFGRMNNAYRWAGETDVFEALASVKARYKIDPKRVVLRGFSMGGAGAWHLGLHHPDVWVAVEAGAGFTETLQYAGLGILPAWQRRALYVYDAADWAANAFNVPIVGYGGENDRQLQASVNVRERLEQEGVRFVRDGLDWQLAQTPLKREPGVRALFLVGPKTGHSWHPKSRARSEAFVAEQAADPTQPRADHVRFVTWTTRYARCGWITVEGLGRHYERTDVDAVYDRANERITIRTSNVSRLRIVTPGPARSIEIDGAVLRDAPRVRADARFTLVKAQKGWRTEPPPQRGKRRRREGLRKQPGLQGPIDDAFTDAFLCVRPTGRSRNSLVGEHTMAELDRFEREFAKWMRGEIPIKDDTAVTARDMRDHHLILFGDPDSNSVLAKVLLGLPLEWTPLSVDLGGDAVSAANHVPVLIYPNPFNPHRYVVVNSGHTFAEEDFRGTNALLFPRLGDWAIIQLAAKKDEKSGKTAVVPEILRAGIFDERWEVE